jgi:predicted amidohydrolase
MRAALVQLCSGDDPAVNLPVTEALIRDAVRQGADIVLTPECTNIVSSDRAHQRAVLAAEGDDATLARLRSLADDLGCWLVIGSLLLQAGVDGPPFVNRSFVIAPDGEIRARYDKIHLFNVTLAGGESYRESAAFRSGDRAVTVDAAGWRLGLSICYDLRFPRLYRDLARAGAQILTIPSAFTVPTGAAHWHMLLRARAIETGCFVLAPAQTGVHASGTRSGRRTYGHSLAVAPSGAVLADGGEAVGVTVLEIDPG